MTFPGLAAQTVIAPAIVLAIATGRDNLNA